MASSTMALARAFTKRVKRGGSEDITSPGRNASVRYGRGPIDRGLISLPTELLSTTNVQVLTAPNINSTSRSSSGSSVTSSSESEFSTIDRGFLDGPSDTSSIEDSAPVTPVSPPTQTIDSFFEAKKVDDSTVTIAEPFVLDAPLLPQRAATHSKKAHVELSRKLSMKRLSPPPSTLEKPAADRAAKQSNTSMSDHPFGRELAQVKEVAEEFGATKALLEEEERDLYHRGLCKFSVQDYIDEIAGLSGGIFEDQLSNPWI